MSARCPAPLPLFAARLAVLLLAFPAVPFPSRAEDYADLSQRVITVGALEDNRPFSFRDGDGQVRGFAVDLMVAITARMNLRTMVRSGPTDEINAAFREGEIDVLQSFAQSRERESFADFSSPYLSMVGAVFVGPGVGRITSLADLAGRRVAVHAGSLGEQVLRAHGLESTIVIVPSVEAALRAVDRGDCDATLASRLTALATTEQLGLRRARVADVQVPGYLVRYCFAVREGDRGLLAALNEGLLLVERSGELERLYRHWFGRVDPRKYSALHILIAVAAGLALALCIALWAFLHQRKLRGRILRQAGLLRASEERFRGLFEGAPDGLLLLAPMASGWVFEDANPAAMQLLGWTEKPRRGRPVEELFSSSQTELARRIAAVQSPAAAEEFEVPRTTAAAAAGWLRLRATTIGPNLQVRMVDVTSAREAELRLRRQEEQLRQTQKLEAIGTLAGGIAHDFNNVLTTIIGNAELMRLDTPKDAPAAESLDAVLAASLRARSLVRQILAFSRQTESCKESICPSSVVREAVEFLRAAAPASIEIRYQPVEPRLHIMADPTQLHQVLMNLGMNGIHAMRGGDGLLEIVEDRLTMGSEVSALHPGLKPGEYFRIAVRDTGCGMTPEVQERIFEPFFTTKGPGEGSGLGLAVAHGIVKNHGGAIAVYSRSGEGTRFHVFFPLAGRSEEAPTSAPQQTRLEGAGEHVLLLDDEKPIAETFGRVLTRLGYRVSAYTDPAEAVQAMAAGENGFAVIITDLAMPRMSGLAVAEHARSALAGVPVILTSGFVGEGDARRARELGVARILEKPLTAENLAAAVASCLGRASS